MKILHWAPQNVTGTLERFVKGHRFLGHESRYLTFFQGESRFPEDICLDLPWIGPMEWLRKFKDIMDFSSARVPITGNEERIDWSPHFIEKTLFTLREKLWQPIINQAAEKYHLWDFDIYHLEGGVSFYRDARDIRELKRNGKKIVSNYHGLDLRVRGRIPAVWEESDLNFTCEFDHFRLYPELEYMFLPFDTEQYPIANPESKKIRICHAPRSREIKGTDKIIAAVEKIGKTVPVELVLIENKPHHEAIRLKASCHIAIDQIARGDMGYGVNSLESLSMGIPTISNLSPAYREFIPDHPFILADVDSLYKVLRDLVLDESMRQVYSRKGKEWVKKQHDYREVAKFIHQKYREKGWLKED